MVGPLEWGCVINRLSSPSMARVTLWATVRKCDAERGSGPDTRRLSVEIPERAQPLHFVFVEGGHCRVEVFEHRYALAPSLEPLS